MWSAAIPCWWSELIQIVDKVFTSLDWNILLTEQPEDPFRDCRGDRRTGGLIILPFLLTNGENHMDFVITELREKGFADASIDALAPFLNFAAKRTYPFFSLFKSQSSWFLQGLSGIDWNRRITGYLQDLQLSGSIELDISLARGLIIIQGPSSRWKQRMFPWGAFAGCVRHFPGSLS